MGYNCCMRLHVVGSGVDVPDGLPAMPPARDFLLSAGFGGAAALIAALVIALVAALVARGAANRHRADLEQQERHHREIREDKQRAAAIARCWQRLVWVVETAGLEPASETATLGLGPELALEILRGLLSDAQQLGDEAVANAVMVHLNQFSLVLAQQAGSLAELGAPSAAAEDQGTRTSATLDASGAAGDAAATAASGGRGPADRDPASRAESSSPDRKAGPTSHRAGGAGDAAPTTSAKAAASRARRRAR